MEDMAGPIRNPQNTRFTGISHVCGHRHFVVLNPSGAIALPDPLAHFGDSAAWALKPRTAKFDASRLLVGPSRPASFLSVLCLGSGRLSSRSDSNNFDLDWLVLACISSVFHVVQHCKFWYFDLVTSQVHGPSHYSGCQNIEGCDNYEWLAITPTSNRQLPEFVGSCLLTAAKSHQRLPSLQGDCWTALVAATVTENHWCTVHNAWRNSAKHWILSRQQGENKYIQESEAACGLPQTCSSSTAISRLAFVRFCT